MSRRPENITLRKAYLASTLWCLIEQAIVMGSDPVYPKRYKYSAGPMPPPSTSSPALYLVTIFSCESIRDEISDEIMMGLNEGQMCKHHVITWKVKPPNDAQRIISSFISSNESILLRRYD